MKHCFVIHHLAKTQSVTTHGGLIRKYVTTRGGRHDHVNDNIITCTGLTPVAIASMPISALYFVSYETAKTFVEPLVPPAFVPAAHSGAAGVAEIVSYSHYQ